MCIWAAVGHVVMCVMKAAQTVRVFNGDVGIEKNEGTPPNRNHMN